MVHCKRLGEISIIDNKIPVVAVVGPTASGKTRLAIDICKIFNGEVISGDSMQLYKKMSIATAKATKEEQAKVKHHLIDIKEPWEDFSVAEFTELTKNAVNDIDARGKLSVIAGGTGLYIRSFLENIVFEEQKRDEEYCAKLFKLAEEKGNEELHNLLKEVDPIAAQNIHKNNVKRVIRALEINHTTGKTVEEQNINSRVLPSPYLPIVIGITYKNKDTLYERINSRVDIMVKDGLLDEAKEVLKMPLSKTAIQAIGYKELIPYFNNEISLDEALETIKINSRHYAKRQITWFKKEKNINWFYVDEYASYEDMLENIEDLIKSYGL